MDFLYNFSFLIKLQIVPKSFSPLFIFYFFLFTYVIFYFSLTFLFIPIFLFFLYFPSSHLFCQVFPGHRLVHLLPPAHLLATSQVPTLFHLGQPPLHGRPPGPLRGHQGHRLTPLLMVLQLLSLLCLNACLQKVQHLCFLFVL